MSTILDSLNSLATPAVGQIAQRLGESDVAVSRGIQTSFACIIGGLVTKSRDLGAISQIFDLFSNRSAAAIPTGDVQSMLSGLTAGPPASGLAGTLLNTLFGGKANGVGDLIARTAGFKNLSSGSSLLGMAAPLVLGFLGKKVRDNGMTVGGLTSLLAGERDSIVAAMPQGLTDLVEAGALPHVGTGEMFRGVAAVGKQTVGAAKTSGGNKWIWPLAAIAAVAIAWFAFTRGRAPSVPPVIGTGAAVLESTTVKTGAAVKAAAGEVTEAAAGFGAFMKKMLPGGIELNIPERGIESKLIAFIEDSTRAVSDTTWFDFDRLNFATGSATILPESQEQINNIVAVLKAYPNVNVKVGGYTDNVGGAAANLRLSQQRANAVRAELVNHGIPANRLQAEGYGEEHPVADNSTEEGRARNRRIALKVTKK